MLINYEKIATYLKSLTVNEHYNWPIPLNKGKGLSLFSKVDIDKFNGLSNFESNVQLKYLISEKIERAKEEKNEKQLKDIFEWTVHDWGGIRGGRNNISKLYKLGIEAIDCEQLKFDRIASTSKILSFYKPKEHIIYDARIVYSLNAIMLLDNLTEKYFPVPMGTNSKMNAFNIEVLIRLNHKPEAYRRNRSKNLISQADKVLFVSESEAYHEMKEAIININKIIYSQDKEKFNCPFYTEMLLFGMADTIIYDRIFNEVEIKIKC